MPCDYSKYAPDWKQIVAAIKARAGNKCEQCAVQNGAVICRSEDLTYWYDPLQDCYFEYPTGAKMPDWHEAELKDKCIKVVLTVAHIDHDINNNAEENLRAWCQLCHLRHDAIQHAQTARTTRLARYAAINPQLDF